MQRYTMQFRPPGFETLPPGVMWEWVEAPTLDFVRVHPSIPRSKHRFGVFTTDRPLTKKEMADFQVTALPDPAAQQDAVRNISNSSWSIEMLPRSSSSSAAFIITGPDGEGIATIFRSTIGEISTEDCTTAEVVRAVPAMLKALMAIQRQVARNEPIRGHEIDLVSEALRLVPGALTAVLNSIHPRPDFDYE